VHPLKGQARAGSSPRRPTLNLGVLAHVDAGKTSLTERLLFAAGVIDALGSVDAGSTQTDSLALERQRGITIKSAVMSFVIGELAVNLIDTPGHPDFIAEVERVLSVLDGAVLVISAVEGVQPQTRILMRALKRLGVPTLIFVNKIDRGGARPHEVLASIAERLSPEIAPMGTVTAAGSKTARFRPYTGADDEFRTALTDRLTSHDDELLAAWVNDESAVSPSRLRRSLRRQTQRGLVYPVFFGSAVTGAGVGSLTAGIAELLPAGRGNPRGPVSGNVFKIERGQGGEKIAYLRLFSGTLAVRDRLADYGDAKITGLSVFDGGAAVPRESMTAGQIGKLRGLGSARVGDSIGAVRPGQQAGFFGPPTLQTVIVPADRDGKRKLHAALTALAEQDPLINLRQDDVRDELLLSLYGEVQKEVIQATLADEHGIAVGFADTITICVERPAGTGAALEVIKGEGNPFLAQVGLRVEPGPIGSGVEFGLEIELGALPYSFLRAIEETVPLTLRQGLYGWEVQDWRVTLTHSGYWPRQSHMHGTFDKSMSSTAGDFRNLTPLVLMAALTQAGTVVCEPLHRFELEIPADCLGPVLPALGRLGGVPGTPVLRGSACVLDGEIPAGRVHVLRQQLPGLSRGEGVLDSSFDRYEPVRGSALPSRARSDNNPLDRKEYLLRVQRGVSGLPTPAPLPHQ
jgi:ribosomal protection tetracycline resistance protein